MRLSFKLKQLGNIYVTGMSNFYLEILKLLRSRDAKGAELAMQSLLDMKVTDLRELHTEQQVAANRKLDQFTLN